MKFPYNPRLYPPAPYVEIWLGIPDESLKLGPLQALVDTGSDATILPYRLIRPLRLQIDDRKFLRSPWGARHRVDIFLLDIDIAGGRLPVAEVVADTQGDEVIVGRNVLNMLRVILDGPKRLLEIQDL